VSPHSTSLSSRAHRILCAGVILPLVLTLLWSGMACALGRSWWSLWPWNRAWFVFSDDEGYLYHLEASGRLEDQSETGIDLTRWFRYPVASGLLRPSRVPRDRDAMEALARYLCRKHNETAEKGLRMTHVSIREVSWRQEAGKRPRLEEVRDSRKRTWFHAQKTPCGPGGEGR
jgi:hypothetical protein